MEYTTRNEKFRGKSSRNAEPVGSLILDLPPSCLEFVPVSKATPWARETPLFVVGTYDLQREENDGQSTEEETGSTKKEQNRQGSLSLFSLTGEVLTEIQTFPTPSALLDLHFFPGTAIFAVAASTGTITIFEIQQTRQFESHNGSEQLKSDYSIHQTAVHQVLDADTIITYFTWDPTCSRKNPRMAITSTTGAVMTLRFNESFESFEFLNEGEVVGQHNFEAWCCAFSEDGETLYSGGDDSKLIMSSLNSELPSSRILPFHDAGVTAILPIPPTTASTDTDLTKIPLLLTGSYDDFIRVYKPPSLYNSKPQVLASRDIGMSGGGVWRLKFLSIENGQHHHDTNTNNSSPFQQRLLVLASCMRVGCKILAITKPEQGDWKIEILAQTAIHESMNYASDFVPLPLDEESSTALDIGNIKTIVSTSFYDRLLFVWRYDPSIVVNVDELEG